MKRRTLDSILHERARQEQLRREGKFPFTCADPEIADVLKLPVLGEEFGEVAKAMNEGDADALREELIQVAAVAVAWIESLDPLTPPVS